MKILNLDGGDYHMHSTNFSDGTSSIDEMVRFAGDIGLTEIAITDHSDIALNKGFPKLWNRGFPCRMNLHRWKNVFNKVNVIFGVEGDLVNEDGEICSTIQGVENDFIILSAHIGVYEGESETITNGYVNAINKYRRKIKFIGHPCNSRCFSKYLDIDKLITTCNEFDIPMEFNATDLIKGNSDMKKTHIMLRDAKYIYVNSDAHSLYELKEHRKIAFNFLKVNWLNYQRQIFN